MNRHIQCVHNDERRFHCIACKKAFKRKRDLDGHRFVVHLHISPFACNICGQAFARQEQLRLHRNKRHCSWSDPAENERLQLEMLEHIAIAELEQLRVQQIQKCRCVVSESDSEY